MVKERPVTHREFTAVLKHLGFKPRPQNGTSHVHWVKEAGGGIQKVTVDEHNSPYHRRMLKLMMAQAGLSKKDFFELLEQV
ncbi:type II toxin-antitoxin system HicA family toxin [Stenotrophomonas maltophilia]|uniref:type II toxin-antitoxin system HicA family toxin n=1 Tax=Stenotrophomonas maltophilia group TaxID=995085 RepID=UPI0018D38D44|nr:type II toxin-antitoxin system HicA family toxin [Stenotrophomonas sepilia]MBH1486529.1 type II toxin-antitoxin system HicA family toxin [Stenotrophomonas maltophilia]